MMVATAMETNSLTPSTSGEFDDEFGERGLSMLLWDWVAILAVFALPEVSRHAFGGVGLHDVHRMVQSEHQQRDDEELQDKGRYDESPPRVGVDRARDEFGHYQGKAVPGNRHDDEDGD